MTGWRASVGWKLEKYFGVEDQESEFEYLGPGMSFSYNPNNNMKYTFTTGSKVYDVASAGKFSGSWSIEVLLDYNHFKWLMAVFEDYHFDLTEGAHVFAKSNTKAMRSFSIKATRLNRIVYNTTELAQNGGTTYDQKVVLLGCIVTSFNPSYESSSGGIVRCTISGSYVNEYLVTAELSETDYEAMEPNTPAKYPVEWGCLQMYDESSSDWVSIANNEKTGIQLSQSIATVPSCGTRFDTAFYESAVQPVSVTAQVVARNPKTWYLRMYSGGETYGMANNTTYRPYPKALKPIKRMRIKSTADDTEQYMATVELYDVTVESMRQQYNPQQPIVDSPSLKAKRTEYHMKTPQIPNNFNFNPSVSPSLTVSFERGTGASGSVSPSTIPNGTAGDTFTFPTSTGLTPPTGKTFAGWGKDGKVYQPGTKGIVDATNNSYTAQWS